MRLPFPALLSPNHKTSSRLFAIEFLKPRSRILAPFVCLSSCFSVFHSCSLDSDHLRLTRRKYTAEFIWFLGFYAPIGVSPAGHRDGRPPGKLQGNAVSFTAVTTPQQLQRYTQPDRAPLMFQLSPQTATECRSAGQGNAPARGASPSSEGNVWVPHRPCGIAFPRVGRDESLALRPAKPPPQTSDHLLPSA